MLNNFEVISYSISGLGYLVLVLLLVVSWKGRIEGGILLAASIFQFVWSVMLALYSYGLISVGYVAHLAEVLRLVIWIVFILRLLTIGRYKRLPTHILITVTVFLVIIVLYSITRLQTGFGAGDFDSLAILSLMTLTVFGLILTEQLYRNIKRERRWAIKYLCLGLGILFVYDLYLYSDAIMMSGVSEPLWSARGVINTLAVPLFVISAARNPKWSFEIFVSRQVVFYSTGLLTIGFYLILISFGGYYIRVYGGEWGEILQVSFFFGAVVVLFALLASARTRSNIKIFLAKHFYKNKYDYREEWLNLTSKISEYKSPEYFYEKVLQTMCGLLKSRGAYLFIEEQGTYRSAMSWNCESIFNTIPDNDELPVFLNKYEETLDLKDYLGRGDSGNHITLPDWIIEVPDAWLIIPLKHQYKLLGFIIMLESVARSKINWEDRELLKACGRQISSYLALIKASEELNEAQQFSAFNRLSAFLVHDLKNLAAQLELVVKNAGAYKTDPEFIDDAISTVENVAIRIQKMLSQLKQVKFNLSDVRRINLCDSLLKVIANCSASEPVPELKCGHRDVFVEVEPDRFVDIVSHLVKNAQEATTSDGFVRVSTIRRDSNIIIEVEDDGTGMDPHFVNTRLFRPFDTTKGNAGMGIGAFEAREFIKNYDGKLQVKSVPGQGTVFEISLPISVSE